MTSFQHPKCYASSLGGCSSKITREHYISEALLQQIHPTPIFQSGVHVGAPDGRYSISSLTAKILCTAHNSGLSTLDAEASKLYAALDAFEKGAASKTAAASTSLALDGLLLERWLLKVAFGVCKGGIATSNGSKIELLRDEATLIRVLYGLEDLPSGWGAYLALPSAPFAAPANFGLEPRTNPATGELLQLVVWMGAFEFWLCLGTPSPISPEQYRPGGLLLLEADTSRRLYLNLTWPPDSSTHSIFEMTRVGQREGWDPRDN